MYVVIVYEIMEKKDLYDIKQYTEKELYEILDLTNPSDRELEAKILMMIHKYENSTAKSGRKLADFFDSMYNHFFENSDSEEEEEEFGNIQESLITLEEAKKKYQTTEDVDASLNEIKSENITTTIKTGEIAKVDESSKKDDTEVIYTTELPYTKGVLNPILKQTTKRIVSIDSQYRSTKNLLSTDFTFNLSEPLKDVVSLKLYSLQIPFTWYTIGKSFGSNFFIFKGKTAGIDNENHDIKIEIGTGNYKPQELIDTVNTAIQTKNQSVDVDLTNVSLDYNSNSSLSTFNIDLKKEFNESSYYLQFDNWGSPFDSSVNRATTIPSYLGFGSRTNHINVLKSPYYYKLEDVNNSTIDDNATFTINSGNNFLTVYQYYGTFPYDSGLSLVDVSLNIKFSLADGTYTRTQLTSNLNTVLQNNVKLLDSSIQRLNLDESNNLFITPLVSQNHLKIKFSRNYANPNIDSRTAVVFPDDTTIWYGSESCFRFDTSINELNTIFSDISAVPQSDKYVIGSSGDLSSNLPRVILTSDASGFETPVNDLGFNIRSSDSDGYTISEYINEINRSVREADASYNLLDPSFGRIFNSPSESYTFDPDLGENPSGTFAYLKDNKFHFYLDVNKTFDDRMYVMDITNSDVFTEGVLELYNSNGERQSGDNIDLTEIYDSSGVSGQVINVSNTNALICFIKPKTGNVNPLGNENDQPLEIRLGNSNSLISNITLLANNVVSAFNNFVDPLNQENVFKGTSVVGDIGTNTSGTTINTFKIKVNVGKKLIGTNYNLRFNDRDGTTTTTNTWKSSLSVDSIFTDQTFDLSLSRPTSSISNSNGIKVAEVFSNGDVLIKASAPIAESNTLTISSGINDTITYVAYEEGVASAGNENNFTITVPAGVYSPSFLVSTINTSLKNMTGLVDVSSSLYSFVDKKLDNGSTISNIVSISNVIKRKYNASDYNLVFFDTISFAQCFFGATSVQNTTWDTTVGWILGFRNFTSYDLSAFYNSSSLSSIIPGDTGISTSLFNYFLLCLDDFNQSRLNDGLVTVTDTDESVPLPSYASRGDFLCDPVTNQKVYNNTTGLTEKQVYAVNEIANKNLNTTAVGSSVSTKSYGKGPYASDVFGIIPIKTNGLIAGAPLIEFGGSLQNQERSYFGPVNISRMSVKLLTDRGNAVDLNNANWSFSLICEQLNNLNPNN